MSLQTLVRIDGERLIREGFHKVFAEVFGFPSFYGQNMDAWIDCMSSLDAPEDGMTSVHAPPGGVLVLQIDNFQALKQSRPDLVTEIVESCAFVNWRRLEIGKSAVLALSFY
jgi:hypothetical protein